MVHPPNTQKNAKVQNFNVKSDLRPSFWRYLACFIISLPLKSLRKLRKLVARANCLRTLEEISSLEIFGSRKTLRDEQQIAQSPRCRVSGDPLRTAALTGRNGLNL